MRTQSVNYYSIITPDIFFFKDYIVFFIIVCKYLQGPADRRRLSYHQALLCKYFHLQYNAFIIYKASKAVPQSPFHEKVPRKHVVNWRGNTSCRSVIPKKLLLCNFFKITPRHRRSSQIRCMYPKNTPGTEHLQGVAFSAFRTHSS